MNHLKQKFVIISIISLIAGITQAAQTMNNIKLDDFLSSHSSEEKVVEISVEPNKVFYEEGRTANFYNFDFTIAGLTDKELIIRFLKVAVYDSKNHLLTFRYVNHNAVGVSGMDTIGKFIIHGKEKIDIYNPFFEFPKNLKIDHLRYMFTLLEKKSGKEFYYGDIIVRPTRFKQKVTLMLPLKGMSTIIDGHDFYSHHRRFSMTTVRDFTKGQMLSNFSRYALDFSVIGSNGNLRSMTANEMHSNYDFHITDVKKFYTHEASVYSPASGEVVDIVNNLDDLYETPFDFDKAVTDNRTKDIAGNLVIIKHNENEYSHLFHLQKGSIPLTVGQKIKQGEFIGKIGFSGAATTYSHLHYQLMDGKDFLKSNSLPCQFSNVTLVMGTIKSPYKKIALESGDFILNKF